MPPMRLPIRLPLPLTRLLLMLRTRLRTRWTTTESSRTEPDGTTKPPPLPRTPLMPTTPPTRLELLTRRINSSEDKTKHLDETDKANMSRIQDQHDQREAANARLK